MSSDLTKQQQASDTQRFVANAYLRTFSVPSQRKRAEKLIGLDLRDALILVGELEKAVGKRKLDNVLKLFSSHSHAVTSRDSTTNKRQQIQKL